jgi:hypothetical protein
VSAPAPERPPADRPPRRNASLTEWLWPIAAVSGLAGVGVLALGIGHPLAVLVLPAVTALAALMADHYVD